MIDSPQLLSELKAQLSRLLDDLRDRVETEPRVGDPLRVEYQQAFDAERTGWTFTEWAEDRLTQVAVGWILACVFVRFCEDNGLLPDIQISGPSHKGDEARAAQRDFFTENPHTSDRDYLHAVFRSAAAKPGLAGVLAEGTNPLWLTNPSADACSELLGLFRRTDDSGALVLDFTDPARDTRFLGDLYQDLSEHAKKTYALLQTPVFVEEFILDRTLDPAIEAFGLADTSLIDCTCGSGHFLLGAFDRLWQRWSEAEPVTSERVLAQRALDAVWGVDLNPFAAAIARFRLLVAALVKCQITRLVDAPDFTIHVAVGDSLLWGARYHVMLPGAEAVGGGGAQFLYATEDADGLRETFSRSYAAVVGNPPYITVKDKAQNKAYRERYRSCSGTYSLGVPFTELFFEIAQRATAAMARPAGFVGLITAHSFMKNQFGKKLVERYLAALDLDAVVDTSGAYIPGHGTPTVILFGRNRPPVEATIRVVESIRGEPSVPPNPSEGLVWSSIVDQFDQPGSEDGFISVADVDRERFATHPWSIGGGGASELKDLIGRQERQLSDVVQVVGVFGMTNADDAMIVPAGADFERRGVESDSYRPLAIGEVVRDWTTMPKPAVIFPHESGGLVDLHRWPTMARWLWPYRTNMGNRATFSKRTYFEEGRPWWEWHQVSLDRLRIPLSITFAFKATHNHFVLDRGDGVFKQTAPILKLPENAGVDDHLGLLAFLNSSISNFWMRQVCLNVGDSTSADGARVSGVEAWVDTFQRNAADVRTMPLPPGPPPVALSRQLDEDAQALKACQPSEQAESLVPTRETLDALRKLSDELLAQMVSAQEELDWHCLHLYGLTEASITVPAEHELPPLALGERAFEIVLARQSAAENEPTGWFTRHRSIPILELPTHWPDWYSDLVKRRIELIESDRNVGLVERPEHKRRWSRTPWEDLEQAALRRWLVGRLEDRLLWFDGDRATTRSLAQLADRVVAHPEWGADWMDVARLWMGQQEIDALAVVAKLVADEHVPGQAAARYKPAGLVKRAEWKRVWELQRAEDRGQEVGRIPVPPKYTQGDFLKASYWKQRGKFDVPKERFASVAGAGKDASSGDGTMVLAWAGFDHAQLAQAVATLLFQRQTTDGWTGERLVPLLAALDEVVPWVEQWHPDVDPSLGQTLGAFYRAQVEQTLGIIGATRDTLAGWRPPAPARGRKAKA